MITPYFFYFNLSASRAVQKGWLVRLPFPPNCEPAKRFTEKMEAHHLHDEELNKKDRPKQFPRRPRLRAHAKPSKALSAKQTEAACALVLPSHIKSCSSKCVGETAPTAMPNEAHLRDVPDPPAEGTSTPAIQKFEHTRALSLGDRPIFELLPPGAKDPDMQPQVAIRFPRKDTPPRAGNVH